MSKLNELYKGRHQREMERFFSAGYRMVSNKYFEFNHIISDDEVIIITSNVRYWRNKDQYVMAVDNDKIVYLKPWQVRKVYNYYLGIEGYAVKISREWFKAYTLPFTMDDMAFDKEERFNDMVEVAKEQNEATFKINIGDKENPDFIEKRMRWALVK